MSNNQNPRLHPHYEGWRSDATRTAFLSGWYAALDVVNTDTAEDDGPIRAGDTVRLTGKHWSDFDMLNDEMEIQYVDQWGDPRFQTDSNTWAVFVDKSGDYSATIVKRAE